MKQHESSEAGTQPSMMKHDDECLPTVIINFFDKTSHQPIGPSCNQRNHSSYYQLAAKIDFHSSLCKILTWFVNQEVKNAN